MFLAEFILKSIFIRFTKVLEVTISTLKIGYHKTDKDKVFNKAIGDIEAATTDLETISCVSATVLHLLKHKKCAMWQTTADVIFARNEFFNLGLSEADIVALADKHVRTHFKRFDSQHK